jgi:hypothetical protein
MLPAVVSGLKGLGPLNVATAVNDGGADAEATLAVSGFAKPKSISLAPLLVSMMFPGFRSR